MASTARGLRPSMARTPKTVGSGSTRRSTGTGIHAFGVRKGVTTQMQLEAGCLVTPWFGGCGSCCSSERRKRRKCHVASTDEATDGSNGSEDGSGCVLEVSGLQASINDKSILKGLNLRINRGEVHAIMGQNGCGKSTLSKVLVGHPDYEVDGGSMTYKGGNLLELEPEERAHAGLFLSFQYPVEVPGVNNTDFLRLACNARRTAMGETELDPLEFYGHVTPILQELDIDPKFLSRNVNEGFSGGERKRNEVLQLAVMDSDLAIMDEVDSGLDIDALKNVADALNKLRKNKKDMSVILITHYQRLLNYIKPDFVHIMKDGRVIKTGGAELALELESEGYASFDGFDGM